MTFVVDTNVLVVANDRETHSASAECVLACARRLRALQQSERIAIDSGYKILGEYFRYARLSGKPGEGDAFVKWVLDNHQNATHCDVVEITPSEDGSYLEFPEDQRLAKFDLNDRKFVAVSAKHPERPPILYALDKTDWGEGAAALADNGITVVDLCPPDE